MQRRCSQLQHFIDLTRQAIAARVTTGEPAGQACRRIFSALETPQAEQSPARFADLPAQRHLRAALDAASAGPASAAALAKAFAAIEPRLSWQRRPGAAAGQTDFAEGHANAVVVGDGGLEQRGDVRIGVSLMAPNIQYPDHRHPPEEVYVALSPGHWRQEARPWHEPGPGGVVYNEPNVIHAMRSTQVPLLAIWCLWMGADQG